MKRRGTWEAGSTCVCDDKICARSRWLSLARLKLCIRRLAHDFVRHGYTDRSAIRWGIK